MKTRIRWKGKVRLCEYRKWGRWRVMYRDVFSHMPSGYPAYPPGDASVFVLMNQIDIEFPWEKDGSVVP